MKDQPGVIFYMLKKRHNKCGRIFRYGGLFLIYFTFGAAAGGGTNYSYFKGWTDPGTSQRGEVTRKYPRAAGGRTLDSGQPLSAGCPF
jgi:hypothetical protein